MSIKEKLEAHPAVLGVALVLISAGGGFALNELLMTKQPPKRVVETEVEVKEVSCIIEGLASFTEAHQTRVGSLQEKLMELESSASDHTLISTHRQKYEEAAVRVRSDINAENEVYKSGLTSLEKKCG